MCKSIFSEFTNEKCTISFIMYIFLYKYKDKYKDKDI